MGALNDVQKVAWRDMQNSMEGYAERHGGVCRGALHGYRGISPATTYKCIIILKF